MKLPSLLPAVVIALVVAACGATAVPASPVPSPLQAHATARPGSAQSASGAPTATPSPDATPLPNATTGTLAASFPIIASCDASAVPEAAPVTTPNTLTKAITLRVPILMYHRIVPVAQAGNSMPGLVVPPERFAAQMDGLAAAGWHTITMATLGADLQAGIAPPAKSFVITFDDGYDDGYTYALPILEAHGYVATYYVIAGRFDKTPFITSDHVRALAAAGMDIGDHTFNHVALGSQPFATGSYQVDAAAARIAQVTGQWPASFAYPYGSQSARARRIVAACGQLRTAVIESPPNVIMRATRAGGGPAPSGAPGADPSASPAAPSPRPAPTLAPIKAPAFPDVYETWANRFELPRLRVTPSMSPAWLVAMLAPYA